MAYSVHFQKQSLLTGGPAKQENHWDHVRKIRRKYDAVWQNDAEYLDMMHDMPHNVLNFYDTVDRAKKTSSTMMHPLSIVREWVRRGGRVTAAHRDFEVIGQSSSEHGAVAVRVPAAMGAALLAGLAAEDLKMAYVWKTTGGHARGRRGDLVVKLVGVPSLDDRHRTLDQVLHDFKREVGALKAFNDGRPVRAGQHTFDIRSVTPRMYCAGYAPNEGVMVIVEDAVPGTTVSTMVHKRPAAASPALLAKLERAVLTLWLAGYAHGDLHHGNVMVTPDGDIRVIDLGRAVQLPWSSVAALRALLAGGGDFQAVMAFWNSQLRPVVEDAVYARGAAAYANIALISELANRQENTTPGVMAAARAAAWMTVRRDARVLRARLHRCRAVGVADPSCRRR